jgi:hypothetical protein
VHELAEKYKAASGLESLKVGGHAARLAAGWRGCSETQVALAMV